ncbi:GyrI-like domain-containing protein [Actinosynnema mirum]|uniref:Transcriptional activator ligand binding domain protein n=1 Tax=Actinosynnema mirum (strain ATCC 29888 / DSM 43827 / JCM 3225 / NBRC 14064 / NCIMB 13271 / NRRL B-12336 / IMRU 3971 / 101) TaxID=446462 RepID=C6WHN1_ACTMD|nr:GyrI-like domain-containing protein [Actinosynnema mirum]ACU39980.1 transcriptional activator ligand binding domain protein [Actinosynnema mirum DSM 43827]
MGTEPELVELTPTTTAVVRGVIGFAEVRDFFDTSFQQLRRVLAEQGVMPVGAAFGLYRDASTHGREGALALEVGFPVGSGIEAEGDVVPGEVPGGLVAQLTHVGAFDELEESWKRLAAWMGARGVSPSTTRWEVYTTEPSPEMDPAELRTELHWAVAD